MCHREIIRYTIFVERRVHAFVFEDEVNEIRGNCFLCDLADRSCSNVEIDRCDEQERSFHEFSEFLSSPLSLFYISRSLSFSHILSCSIYLSLSLSLSLHLSRVSLLLLLIHS